MAEEAFAPPCSPCRSCRSHAFQFIQDFTDVFTLPFLNRVGVVFPVGLAAAEVGSRMASRKPGIKQIKLDGVSDKTSLGFNIAGAGGIAFLIAVYAIWR